MSESQFFLVCLEDDIQLDLEFFFSCTDGGAWRSFIGSYRIHRLVHRLVVAIVDNGFVDRERFAEFDACKFCECFCFGLGIGKGFGSRISEGCVFIIVVITSSLDEETVDGAELVHDLTCIVDGSDFDRQGMRASISSDDGCRTVVFSIFIRADIAGLDIFGIDLVVLEDLLCLVEFLSDRCGYFFGRRSSLISHDAKGVDIRDDTRFSFSLDSDAVFSSWVGIELLEIESNDTASEDDTRCDDKGWSSINHNMMVKSKTKKNSNY